MTIKNITSSLSKELSYGMVAELPPYLNIPKVYYGYHQELKSILELKPKILNISQSIIDETLKKSSSPPERVVIGIHVRSNGAYKMHLKTLNAKPIGSGYYHKAISYFRNLYGNPLFLVVSDSEEAAMNKIIKSQLTLGKKISILKETKLLLNNVHSIDLVSSTYRCARL